MKSPMNGDGQLSCK